MEIAERSVVEDRVRRLLAGRSTVSWEPATGEPFHAAWLAHAGEPEMACLAHAIVGQWLGSRLIVAPDEMVVGRLALRSVVFWRPGGGICFHQTLWDEQHAAASAAGDTERLAELDALAATWRDAATKARIAAVLTPMERAVMCVHSSCVPGCHSAPLYVRLAEEGTPGLRERVRASRAAHLGQPGTEPAAWYDAMLVLLDGLDALALAYAGEARAAQARAAQARAAMAGADPARAVELGGIAARLERTFRRPAASFADAVQAYWLAMVVQDPAWADSPCRFDQDLWPILARDLDRGALTLEEAQGWVDWIWWKWAEHRCWSITLSGQTLAGDDATNPLTWLLLSALERYRTDAPNVELRVHPGTPRDLLERCCALLAGGLSMPALVNDEPVIRSLVSRGVPLAHARDYTLVGCTQVVVRGRSGGAYEDSIATATKPLELALHDGVDPMTGQRMGPATGAPEVLTTYEALENAYRAQLDHTVRTITEVLNRQYALAAQLVPDLFKSLLVEGCLERGLDYHRGGPLYTEGLVDVLGITNVADSLLVLRRLVYEGGRLTLPEFVAVLDRDWEGAEALRLECLRAVPKFGNDDPEADALAERVFRWVNDGFKARERVFGMRYGIDVVGWTGAVEWGRKTAATPDGRRCGAALCDSVGASQGLDRAGVTAAIRSTARLPHSEAHGILALNLRFAGRTFQGSDGVDKMVMLVDSAFSQGLQQLQINVVDARVLREAQEHPDEYESLMVRIGGFSTYFGWLSRAHQDDIIARTEHEC